MTKQTGEFTPGFGRGRFGCDFFPNAIPDPDSLVSDLTTGTSVAALGLLRIGKTSLLLETRERLQVMGKNAIFVNLDAHDSLAKALVAILNSMQAGEYKDIVTELGNWAENTDHLSADFKTTVRALTSGAFDSAAADFNEKHIDAVYRQIGHLLELQEPENKPIIIFDELTTLIKHAIDDEPPEETRRVVARLNSFLGLLRHWRTADIGLTMAISGSVSFDWLRQEYGIRSDSINDCVRARIEELDRNGAENLLEMCIAAKKPAKWSKQLTAELLDFLPSYFPGVVQLAFRVISAEPTPVSTLNGEIRYRLDRELWDYYYNQFSVFFQRFGPSKQNRINKLLDALAATENGEIDGGEAYSLLNSVDISAGELNGEAIMTQLKAGSFIDIASSGIRFTSGLVPAWHKLKRKKQL